MARYPDGVGQLNYSLLDPLVLGGTTFRKFKAELQILVHPSFALALMSRIERISSSLPELNLSEQDVLTTRELSEELILAKLDLITFSMKQASIFDLWRCTLKDWTGATWDWWPLKPPMQPLRNQNMRLS